MGRVIIKGIVKRQAGFIYFIDSKGNLCLDTLDENSHLNKKYQKIKEIQEKEELLLNEQKGDDE